MTHVLAMALVTVLLAMGGPARAQAPVPLAAAVGGNMNHVPSFVGVEKGIFLKHGIDMKLKVLSTGQEMSKALQAGEVEIIGAAYSNFPVAVERGMAAKGVVGLMGDRTTRHSDSPISIWTRKGTGITKVADLAGRKVGTPVGGTGDEYLRVAAKNAGIARDNISVLNVPPGNLVSALQGGGVEAVSCWEPFGSLVQARIPDAVLVSRGGGNIGYYINMSFRTETIDQKPDLVERYVIAMAEATQYTRQHLDEAAKIATRWVAGLEYEVARESIRHMVFDSRITPHTIAAWEENVGILIEQKKLRKAVPWQQGVEPRFIEKVMKSHPQLFSDLKPVP